MTHCPHSEHKLPHWKTGERQDRLRFIGEQLDNPARTAREIFGQTMDSYESVLPREKIKEV